MKLYEFAPTRSIRARWTLQELGVDFDAVTINLAAGEHRQRAFLTLNPAGKVPVLVDGDLVLTESVAIAMHLADKYPDKGLAPRDPRLRSELNQWLLFSATELEQPLWRISRNTSLYAEDQRQPKDVAIARKEFADMAAVAEQHMQDRPFVLGERVSIGDFVLAYTLDWATQFQLLEGFPRLTQYMLAMYARPRAALRIADAFASLTR